MRAYTQLMNNILHTLEPKLKIITADSSQSAVSRKMKANLKESLHYKLTDR